VNSNNIEKKRQDLEGENWVDRFIWTYNYDEKGNMIEELRQHWEETEWINDYWENYIYDENGYKTDQLLQEWNGENCENYKKHTYGYDNDGNSTEEFVQKWSLTSWENYQKFAFFWLPFTTLQELTVHVNNFQLSQNYPNPFNPSTRIEFTLPKSEFVILKIFNIIGQEVETLVNGKLNAGNHTYQFDGSNLTSGVYMYRIEAREFQQVRKMVLIK